MKVAVASSDGIVVNQHFGRADTFYIYELKSRREAVRLEKRKGMPFCRGGEHEDQDLLDAVHLLADCEKVFVLQIGRGAEDELLRAGIEPVIAPGIISEVLDDYMEGGKGKHGR